MHTNAHQCIIMRINTCIHGGVHGGVHGGAYGGVHGGVHVDSPSVHLLSHYH